MPNICLWFKTDIALCDVYPSAFRLLKKLFPSKQRSTKKRLLRQLYTIGGACYFSFCEPFGVHVRTHGCLCFATCSDKIVARPSKTTRLPFPFDSERRAKSFCVPTWTQTALPQQPNRLHSPQTRNCCKQANILALPNRLDRRRTQSIR